MTITILVSVAEEHEAFVKLMAVKLPSPLDGACLSQEQMLELLEQLQPELVRERLTKYAELNLLFLVDGLPSFEQNWSHWPCGAPGERSLPIGPGVKLWLNSIQDMSLKSVSL